MMTKLEHADITDTSDLVPHISHAAVDISYLLLDVVYDLQQLCGCHLHLFLRQFVQLLQAILDVCASRQHPEILF
jgi:hypothetical protein